MSLQRRRVREAPKLRVRVMTHTSIRVVYLTRVPCVGEQLLHDAGNLPADERVTGVVISVTHLADFDPDPDDDAAVVAIVTVRRPWEIGAERV